VADADALALDHVDAVTEDAQQQVGDAVVQQVDLIHVQDAAVRLSQKARLEHSLALLWATNRRGIRHTAGPQGTHAVLYLMLATGRHKLLSSTEERQQCRQQQQQGDWMPQCCHCCFLLILPSQYVIIHKVAAQQEHAAARTTTWQQLPAVSVKHEHMPPYLHGRLDVHSAHQAILSHAQRDLHEGRIPDLARHVLAGAQLGQQAILRGRADKVAFELAQTMTAKGGLSLRHRIAEFKHLPVPMQRHASTAS
jgi:hypothetical protein